MSLSISIPAPLHVAGNTTLYCYVPSADFPTISKLQGGRKIHDDLLSPSLRGVLQVCFLYFCRIRELLNLTVGDIVPPDRVICKGLKRSNSYVIFLPGLSSQVSALSDHSNSLRLFPFSYSQCYRGCVRAGIRLSIDGSKNLRRLHSSRYIFSVSATKLASDQCVSQLLRHKSLSSLSHYIQPSEASNG